MLLSILDQQVRVDSTSTSARALLEANFQAMAVTDTACQCELHYSVTRNDQADSFSLQREGERPQAAHGYSDLLALLERDMVVELQKRRPDLYFLHAAAVDWNGRACLLAADSGHGKSSLTWALLHHQFSYLSDELSPVDLAKMEVLAYPHALCLKQAPAAPYLLPGNSIHLDRTIHVPVAVLPGAVVREARRIGAIFLLRHDPRRQTPELHPLGAAEASARLYANALNALAHPSRGLDAAVRLAQHVPCFALTSADLVKTCALFRSTVAGVQRSRIH